ncbi:hypothetical protein TNCV_1157441 [Trichonephila clavipes]|nr:hypothetical protein TNCV_1157441 [Trichonephila clavipes]
MSWIPFEESENRVGSSRSSWITLTRPITSESLNHVHIYQVGVCETLHTPVTTPVTTAAMGDEGRALSWVERTWEESPGWREREESRKGRITDIGVKRKERR